MEESSEVFWFDAAGNALPDAEGAVTCEVVEYLDGVPVRRTYADLKGDPAPSVEPPVEVYDSEDWIKTTWDLFDHDQQLVTTRAQLFEIMGVTDQPLNAQRALLFHLMELPSWDAAPKQLQEESYDWLRAATGDDGGGGPTAGAGPQSTEGDDDRA